MTRRNSLVSLFPASRSIFELIILANPVWNMAPPTTKSPIIMITTELEKPDKASSGVSIWQTSSATSAQSATKSERTFPFTKNIAESTSMPIVIHMAGGSKEINYMIIRKIIPI